MNRLSITTALIVLLVVPTARIEAQVAFIEPTTPSAVVDNVEIARAALDSAREAARTASVFSPAERARRMIELGMWTAVDSLLANTQRPGLELRLAEAELMFQRHDFDAAERILDGVLAVEPEHRGANLLQAQLEIQAWELDQAAETARALLRRDAKDEAAALILGRLALLEKNFDAALEWAKTVEEWNPGNADAYLLEADTRFWAQDPAGAEAPLVRALSLDPFDPDARFNYGYAIWRRVDATQLDAMAAQWDLALEIDPLHYLTHWHWGNGHTNLTYADYAVPSDSIVRELLAPADSLISAGEMPAAIQITRQIQRQYPESVLPAMMRGSAFYMAYGMDEEARLDSAQAAFEGILERKSHYGPAHNGLAAVIKQRQFRALTSIDSLEAVIAATPLPGDPDFEAVFPDVDYYPGDRVKKMVRSQLGPSVAYVPLLERMGREFVIPPLHKDLAEAMDRPSFRTSTTFDNRQWMDIRGVGSGAAAIEYVERGSHWERNVVAHEYTHLFHGRVLTDREVRRIRDLYHTAMREGRTLDYYASNNESEFFAQAYEAYLSSVKAHPLTHKAMNTRDDLRRKDPATYAFVDSLVARQNAFLAGDTTVIRGNWAQVYVSLSEDARGEDESDAYLDAVALLDTAFAWQSDYLPAILSRAALERDEGHFAAAADWLARAQEIDAGYAPIYAALAELEGAMAAENGSEAEALSSRASLLGRALELEEDLAVRASINRDLRQLFRDYSRIPEAIEAAENYVTTAPTLSTYLRDRRDEAAAFANELRAATGYAAETLQFFHDLVGQKPQNFELRGQYADALIAAGRADAALETLNEAQKILGAAGRMNAGFISRIASIHAAAGDLVSARAALEPILDGAVEAGNDDLLLIRVLASVGEVEAARVRLSDASADVPLDQARLSFTRGWVSEMAGDTPAAQLAYRSALAANPYHLNARIGLIRLLRADQADDEASAVIAAAEDLPLPLGPAFTRAIG